MVKKIKTKSIDIQCPFCKEYMEDVLVKKEIKTYKNTNFENNKIIKCSNCGTLITKDYIVDYIKHEDFIYD